MNAIGYLRLSMRDQSRYSLEYQEASIKEYCSRNDITLLALFKDNGQCSDNFDRPDYIALENFIKKHKGVVRYLIVMDHDRFSRNLPEALMKIESLQKKFQLKVLATNEAPDIDVKDPDVFMNRAFKYLMANNELLRIRQRTSRGIRQALEGGRFVNKAPYGYVNKKAEGRKGVILVDDFKANIVRKIFFDFLLGYSLKQVRAEAIAMGYTGVSKSAVRRVLENCIYAGLIKIPESISGPEKYVKGIHPAIISSADYWRCQEILGNKPRQKTIPSNDVPLRGILKHECGANMTAGYSKGKTKYYLYYRCIKCSGVNVPGSRLHLKFNELLVNLSLTGVQVEFLANSVKRKIAEAFTSRETQAILNANELEALQKKVDTLEEKLLAGVIENQTYQKWNKKYLLQKSKLQSALANLGGENEGKLDRFFRLLPKLADLPAIFSKASIFQKHSMLREVFKHGLTYASDGFRTPSINPVFAHNILNLNKKGLLTIEQPSEISVLSTGCSAIGI